MEKRQKAAATTFIVSIVAIALMFLFYAFTEKSPLMYSNIPFPVVNQVIHPGDGIPFRVSRCNLTSVPTKYRLKRYLIALDDNRVIDLGAIDIVLASGCRTEISEINNLPLDTPPGRYRLVGTAEIQGVMKHLEVTWYTETFVVSAVKYSKNNN